MNSKLNMDWMDETIEKVPGGQGKYRLLCLILFKRRLTYLNMYAFTYELHRHKFRNDENKLKIKILKELALIYYFNNHRLPDGFELEITEDID